MKTGPRAPLFITRFSLSQRTAVGVQTVRLMRPHPDWLHFHWWSSSLKRENPRSVLFENPFLSRYSFLHNPGLLRVCERLGISMWKGPDLQTAKVERLTNKYRDRVSSAYVAPLDESDAQRCRKLLDMVGSRFVLHLWDVLQGDLSRGALRELVERAETVFCVSRPLLRDVSRIRGDAELLYFSRDHSLVRAKAPEGGPLKIVMHGNISSYAEGLDDLDIAIALLERTGIEVEVTFLGSPKILRQAKTSLTRRVRAAGFCPTQQELDRQLSRAHVAFLPGPKLDPAQDLRSRYSIPSRILDYMALELPIVGTVHKASATYCLVEELGLAAPATCSGPEEIADWLSRLTERHLWTQQSAKSRHAFDLLHNQEDPAQRLKRALDSIAFEPSANPTLLQDFVVSGR